MLPQTLIVTKINVKSQFNDLMQKNPITKNEWDKNVFGIMNNPLDSLKSWENNDDIWMGAKTWSWPYIVG